MHRLSKRECADVTLLSDKPIVNTFLDYMLYSHIISFV